MKIIKIKSLLLKNFKGIRDLQLNFDSNVTNIYGENATGKTTIVDAFMWILFDKDSQDRTAFEIKTLNQFNQVIHGLEHEVSAVLNIDGIDTKLSKVYKEKWTKKKGEAERVFTGHETIYYIDEVPTKKGEFQKYIDNVINEQSFKLISNPLYFNQIMNWKDRRNVLMSVIGDIDDLKVINSNSKLKELKALLEGTNIDTLKKRIAAKKKIFNDDIKQIPTRIDECNNSIIEIDFELIEKEIRDLEQQIKEIDEQITDKSKINESILNKRDEIFRLKSKLRDIEEKAKLESERDKRDLESKLKNNQSDLIFNERLVQDKQREKDLIVNKIEKLKKENETLRSQYMKAKNEELVFDEKKFACPTCKRLFPDNQIESTKLKMTENFNQEKQTKLSDINTQGIENKEKIQEYEKQLEKFESELSSIKIDMDEIETNMVQLTRTIKEFVPVNNLESNGEYTQIQNKIKELEAAIAIKDENSIVNELKTKKSNLNLELQSKNRYLASKTNNEKLRLRINDLLEEEKILAQQIAELEGNDFLCESFIKTKVELVESSINNKFKYVKFKLFNTLVNGSIDECCEALIEGVPFGNANTASKLNAGLDIINTLSEFYQIQTPIFLDNRESVNRVIDCKSQIINLIVSNDKKLTVK